MKKMPEPESEVEEVDPMEDVAEMLNSYISTASIPFTIGMPMTVTVTKKDGTFSKRPMIGGESFKVLKFYVGKRKAIICCFTPLQVSDFLTIEMPLAEAKKAFGTDFAAYIDKADGGLIGEALIEATKVSRDAAEAAKNEGKAEQYSDIGYGTW